MKKDKKAKKQTAPSPVDALGSTGGRPNLLIGSTRVELVATKVYEPVVIGIPIMREDFVTETGLFPPSADTSTQHTL